MVEKMLVFNNIENFSDNISQKQFPVEVLIIKMQPFAQTFKSKLRLPLAQNYAVMFLDFVNIPMKSEIRNSVPIRYRFGTEFRIHFS